MKKLNAVLMGLVCLLCLTGSKCMGDTPIEVCMMHPKYGAVCVKINGKSYDINRTDLTADQTKEVKEWVAEQSK